MDCYVVLHFMDSRRMFGWPLEWPGHSESGHFLMREAEWLADDKRIPLEDVEAVLVPAEDVRIVEFVQASKTSGSTDLGHRQTQ